MRRITFPLALAALLACERNDPGTTTQREFEKSIDSVVFKRADHSGWDQDIRAAITGDTVRAVVPSHTALTGLVPTVSFTGQSITPASGSAQDFSRPRIYTVKAEDGTARRYVFDIKRQPSSEKLITSVVFMGDDHPGWFQDAPAVISGDTVRALLPYNANPSSLKPTVVYKGQSLSPASGTAQDFRAPLTYTVTAEDGTTRRYVFAVSLRPADSASLLSGRWKVIKDSVSNVGNFYYQGTYGQAYPNAGVYWGRDTDFWDFGFNGMVSVSENGITGTRAYRLLPGGQLDIDGWTEHYKTATVVTLTTTETSYYWTQTSANGGQYYRRVYLKR